MSEYGANNLKETRCKYCNISNNESKLITLGNWINLDINRNSEGDYYIVAISDGRAEAKINYCPFCGRKLSEDY